MMILKFIMLESVIPFIKVVASTPVLERRKDIYKPSQISDSDTFLLSQNIIQPSFCSLCCLRVLRVYRTKEIGGVKKTHNPNRHLSVERMYMKYQQHIMKISSKL